ncbi:myo-inosose-2 dehydratase [Celeribacter marinus]|uniref:Inosose dehydratase n=1 Tax=Celeribacter marinus TaxID=1397108 RepID=A0A0N9ZF04_9RHOB|nr:myo-inosose-2 dehydratase [Celeribacter marinus]ALI54150.1 inosose dehydratase [Celeribacter marinus]SFL09893.1 2-keto-myo-inositol dehydratase [Celeribacter marinus]
MIKFGTNPIAWANDDDQSLGADIPTIRILDEAGRQIGFDGIENGHRWPQDDPEALRTLLADYGLTFISGWHSLGVLANSIEDEKAAIQPHLDKLKHNGCTVCIACETSNTIQGDQKPLSERPTLDAAGMKDFAIRVEAIAQYCADQGIDLVYHHHMGTVVQSPADIDAFMAETLAAGGATKLLFDAGHCYFGGGDPAVVLAKHAARVRHFHAKNVRPKVRAQVEAEGWSFMDGVRGSVFTVPGDQEGAVEFEPLLQILKDTSYEGWIVIEAEQDPDLRNPLLYQTLGLATLKRLARETGLI